jgi:hypothetical protein
MKLLMPTQVRDATARDVPFIFGTWINSMKSFSVGLLESYYAHIFDSSPRKPHARVRRNPMETILDGWMIASQHTLVERLLDTQYTYIAVDPHDSDQIHGFATCNPDRRELYWIYTKSVFRRYGVGTALMQHAFGSGEVVCSFTTPAFDAGLGRAWGINRRPWILTRAIRTAQHGQG